MSKERDRVISAYCHFMGSRSYYREAQIAEAKAINAPNVTYSVWQGKASRLSDLPKDCHTALYFAEHHPDLYSKFIAPMVNA